MSVWIRICAVNSFSVSHSKVPSRSSRLAGDRVFCPTRRLMSNDEFSLRLFKLNDLQSVELFQFFCLYWLLVLVSLPNG